MVRDRPRKMGKAWIRKLRFLNTISDVRGAIRAWRKYEAKLRKERVRRRIQRRKGN